MSIPRRTVLSSLAVLGVGACVSPRAISGFQPAVGETIEPDEIVPLWPAGVPGGIPEGLSENIVFRDNAYGLTDRAAHNVTRPILSVFKPAQPDGSAILIIPGGGYKWVVVDKEGYEGARHFITGGATVYVLRYRLPHQGWVSGAETPLQDAQRAVRVIRSRGTMDGVDPARLMVMGFSAGGHLAGMLATRYDAAVYDAQDTADGLSARPDAAALMYPVATMTRPFAHEGSRLCLIGEDPSAERIEAYSLENCVRADMPPVFLMHAEDDDAVPVENSLMLYQGLREAGCAAAMHLFEDGGHGFGMRGIEGTPRAAWPGLIRDWGRAKGIFQG